MIKRSFLSFIALLPLALSSVCPPCHPIEERKQSAGYIFDAYPPLYHPVWVHWLTGVSSVGESVKLEDGSIWEISRYDGPKALGWRSSDPLVITQNHRWFSDWNYRIINQNTGGCLEVNLFLGPIANGERTFYIQEMDRIYHRIILARCSGDETRWEVSLSDDEIFYKWAIGDPIIVGQNSGWDSSFDSILINVNMDVNRCVRARLF